MKTFVLCLSVLALLAAPPLAHAQTKVLMPGPPPLTEEMIGRFAEFFEWAFDVRLTNDQVNVLRKYSVTAWTHRQRRRAADRVVQGRSKATRRGTRELRTPGA
jgi:hypothetical protein